MEFVPTREAGLSRLKDFAPAAGGRYARLRNSDFGKGRHDHVSTLSPYIKHRLITEREVAQAAIDFHGLRNSENLSKRSFGAHISRAGWNIAHMSGVAIKRGF